MTPRAAVTSKNKNKKGQIRKGFTIKSPLSETIKCACCDCGIKLHQICLSDFCDSVQSWNGIFSSKYLILDYHFMNIFNYSTR